MSDRPALYCDFDGVLNDNQWWMLSAADGEWLPAIHPRPARTLQAIIRQTDPDFVVISAWARHLHSGDMTAELETALDAALQELARNGDDWRRPIAPPTNPWLWTHSHLSVFDNGKAAPPCSFLRRCLDGEGALKDEIVVRLIQSQEKKCQPS